MHITLNPSVCLLGNLSTSALGAGAAGARAAGAGAARGPAAAGRGCGSAGFRTGHLDNGRAGGE